MLDIAGRVMYISKALKGRLAQLVERFVYTEEVSQVRALYRPPCLFDMFLGVRLEESPAGCDRRSIRLARRVADLPKAGAEPCIAHHPTPNA